MRYRLSHYANPLHRAGGYATPHAVATALVLLVVFLAGFGTGWWTRTTFDAHYFKARYSFPGVHEPRSKVPAAVPEPVIPHALPRQASIDISRYPAVGDQGQIGSCAAWATAWAYSYEYRTLHPKSFLRFSPRYMYDHYSDTYNGGQDGGSWPDQNLETASTYGTPRFTQLPYPPYQIDQSIPAVDAYGHSLSADAAKLRLPVQIHALTGFSVGPGQGAVDALRATLNGVNTADGKPHPVLVALEVTQEYDNATQQPLIVYNANSYNRGGHENVILAYDDSLQFPDGSVGGVRVRNQWSANWGTRGDAWLSYDFIRNATFGLEYLTIGSAAPGRSPIVAGSAKPYFPSHAPLHPAPTTTGAPRTGAVGWYVRGIVTRDTHVDISSLIDAAGDRYHISPLMVSAMIGVESNVRQYAPHYPLPGTAYCDYSAGLTQVTVCTAHAYCGAGDGSLTSWNIAAVFAWENVPANAIDCGARLLANFHSVCGVDPPYLYACYNQGPYKGYQWYGYYHPTDYYGAQALNSFLGWWSYALTYWQGPAPQPKPFPAKKWGSHPYKVGGRLTWPASIFLKHQQLGRYRGGHWYKKRHQRHGYDLYRYAHGRAYAWPDFHRAKVRVEKSG